MLSDVFAGLWMRRCQGNLKPFDFRIHQNLSMLKTSITVDRVCDVMRFTNLSVDSNE